VIKKISEGRVSIIESDLPGFVIEVLRAHKLEFGGRLEKTKSLTNVAVLKRMYPCWSLRRAGAGSNLYRLLKNSVHPSTELRANGISLEITSKYPFMLSQVEACKLFFNSLFTFDF
jgi:hypothetical protein